MIMRDHITAKERIKNFSIGLGKGVMNNLKANYEVEAQCDDCGEDIEEVHYTNEKNERVHVTTHTNGHYYSDGSTRCEDCHEGNL